MTDVQWEHYPLVTQMQHAQMWLQLQANLGLAPNTVAAYGRALNDYHNIRSRPMCAGGSVPCH